MCPAALKLNWRREIRMIFPEALIEVVGFDSEPVKDARWIIVNYCSESTPKDCEQLSGPVSYWMRRISSKTIAIAPRIA